PGSTSWLRWRASPSRCGPSASACGTWTSWPPRRGPRASSGAPPTRPVPAAERLSPPDGDGARELAASAAQELSAVAEFAPELGDVAATLDDIAARIQDAAVELRGHLAGLEADPARLELVESRLEAFAQLERRYAAPVGEVVEQAGAARR